MEARNLEAERTKTDGREYADAIVNLNVNAFTRRKTLYFISLRIKQYASA